jgi:hypothetical protein
MERPEFAAGSGVFPFSTIRLPTGPRIAAILSIVETCRLRLPIRDYLAAILPGLADFPANRVHQLTPAAWVPGK